MKTFCLILSITLLIFFTSCNSLYKLTPGYWKIKSEFKKELEFVENILDNPDKMQEIIESSEFYDNKNFDMSGNSYKFYIEYLKPNKDGDEAEISDFGITSLGDGKGRYIWENAKAIGIYKPNSYNEIVFLFMM